MNINTLKLLSVTILAHFMCMTVVLSHIHAKDAISYLGQSHAARTVLTTDMSAKALGDLHHHIDKTALKNIHTESPTTAARRRELQPLNAEDVNASLLSKLHDFALRLRVVVSLCYRYAYA